MWHASQPRTMSGKSCQGEQKNKNKNKNVHLNMTITIERGLK